MAAQVGLSTSEYMALRSKIRALKSKVAGLNRVQTDHVASDHFALAAATSDLIRQTLEEAEKAQQILKTLSLGESNEND